MCFRETTAYWDSEIRNIEGHTHGHVYRFSGHTEKMNHDMRLARLGVIPHQKKKKIRGCEGRSPSPARMLRPEPVSYTHLDVYKRQVLIHLIGKFIGSCSNVLNKNPLSYCKYILKK